MDFSYLRYDVDRAVATVTISRPDKLNALNQEMLDELLKLFESIDKDEEVRAVIITGEGEKSFVSGADIGQFSELDALSGAAFAQRGQSVFSRIEQLSKPVIAAVNGFALGGGCELAISCHLRIASESARFGQPEVDLGLIPGYGGTQRLPRLIGRGLAAELVLTGEQISADRAAEIGLVNRVVEPDRLLDAAREMAQSIAEKAPHAVRLTLQALRSSDLPLERGLQHEAVLFGQAASTEDATEGAAAFMERRKPEFVGR